MLQLIGAKYGFEIKNDRNSFVAEFWKGTPKMKAMMADQELAFFCGPLNDLLTAGQTVWRSIKIVVHEKFKQRVITNKAHADGKMKHRSVHR